MLIKGVDFDKIEDRDRGEFQENVNMAAISESDLILLLGQFPIRPLLNLTFRHFPLICQGHRVQILYSLVSFIGTLLKILDQGLQNYDTMRNFCKKIADIISKILYYFCAYWCLIRTELLETERRALQNEVNRIVLQAIYYIVSKRSALICQFLVDLPYGAVSENCRLRCQLLMRSPPNRKAPTVSELYAIPDSEFELLGRVKNGVPLSGQLGGNSRENDDLTYTVSALASVISQSEQELLHFVTEIIDICFLNENSREKFYKIGSEAMATLIDRNPSLLGPVLRYIDRHLDHLDDYAVNILNKVPLQKCTLTTEDVTDRLGKWLIQRLDLYKAQIGEWKESYRGPLSWFSSGYNVHPPLISATNFNISSWATYLLLCAEQRTFPEFYDQLHQAFGKHPTRSVEECLKKSPSRSHIPFTLDQLAYYRWLQFICADESSELPQTIFLLSLQQLAIAMFSQKQLKDGVLSRTICPGWHYYFRCKPSEPLFTQLRTKILQKMESPEANGGTIQKGEQNNVNVNQSTAPIQCHALVNAFAQWIGTELCYKPEMRRGQDFADLPMSYLLQIIISGDRVNAKNVLSKFGRNSLPLTKWLESFNHKQGCLPKFAI